MRGAVHSNEDIPPVLTAAPRPQAGRDTEDTGTDASLMTHSASRIWSTGSPDAERRVILVPGLAVCKYLRPMARAMSRWARVDIIALAGQCRAPGAARPIAAVSELADELRRWWDAEALNGATLIGHSIGSQVAAEATAHGLRPEQLVLASPTLDPALNPIRRLVRAWLANSAHERASLAAVQMPEWLRAGPRTIAAAIRACRNHDLCATVAQIHVPTTVIRGRQDRLSSRAWAQSLGDNYREMPGAHTFPYSYPEQCAQFLHHCIGATR
jgi:pimeloyl-ACP methyl ester carboxylesterase